MTDRRRLDGDVNAMARGPYGALEAFLLEHRLCRPGPDDPHITDTAVALWCACGARIAVALPPPPVSPPPRAREAW